MIIVKLWGGMCNQMFQYAFGYALAKKYNDELRFDIDFYKNQPIQHNTKRSVIGEGTFHLTRMNFIERPTIARFFENKYISHLIRYNSGCLLEFPKLSFFMEKLHKYYPNIPYKNHKDNYYDGYWQTEKYFYEFASEIKEEFTPPTAILEHVDDWRKKLRKRCCVAVHIRRGDYLDKVNQKTLHDGNIIGDVNYYRDAMEYMKSKLDNPTFCFFSDDIEWCKKTFGCKENHIYVENNGKESAALDLFSISRCEHGIMSPSTFSWWGNWLRQSEDSIVIAPKGNYSNDYFIDDNWIKL